MIERAGDFLLPCRTGCNVSYTTSSHMLVLKFHCPEYPRRCFQLIWLFRPLLRMKVGRALLGIMRSPNQDYPKGKKGAS